MNNESEAYAIDADMSYDSDEPADFSSALFDKKNGRGYTCYLCTHSNGSLSSGGMKAAMDRIDSELCGRIEDEAIFDLQAEYYKQNIYDPLKRHEPDSDIPLITASDCKRHYMFHAINPQRLLCNDIKFLNNAQRFLQKNGILNKNRGSGKYKMDLSFLKQWNILSRNKLDLLRYYKQEYGGEEETGTTSSGPTEFNSF